jgi:hypothetical protein
VIKEDEKVVGESNIEITIEYLLIDSDKWNSKNLTPKEYFDPDYNDKDDIDVDSLPLHDNDEREYLDIGKEKISSLITKLKNNKTGSQVVFHTTYWNNGNNNFTERKDSGPIGSYHELIYGSKIQENPTIWETLRLVKKCSTFFPKLHSFITDNPDGTQSEEMVFPKHKG